MNYYAARQRLDGRWNWTCQNDDLVVRCAPCTFHLDGHRTKEDAERHFYDHELNSLKEAWSKGDVQYQCAVPGCGAWTQEGLCSPSLFVTPIWLCDVHRNREEIESLYPFTPGYEIWASY